MTELWFAPNVGSNILPLFERPEEWPEARASISTVQLYVQNVLADHVGDMNVGANTYQMLKAVDAFAWLRDRDIGLALEAGAVKPWSCDGVAALGAIRQAIDRVRAAGGEVSAIVLDEPAGSRAPCHLTIEQAAIATSRVIDGIRAHGVQQVVIVEPWPYVDMATLVRFFELIQQEGSSPSGWHLDVDRFGIRDQKISPAHVAGDLRWPQGQCAAWQIPFGVIVFGQRVIDAAGYRRSAWEWAEQLHGHLGGWPDRLILQSWEQVNGENSIPHNLPETDATSHTGLLRDLAGRLT